MYIMKHLNPAMMQPSYASLPVASHPEAVAGMCYVVNEAHIDRVKGIKT